MNTPTLINDDTRQRYLREMGIAVYFPRHPLPGAAASRQYHTDTYTDTDTDTGVPTGREEGEPGSPGKMESGNVPEGRGPGSAEVPASLESLKDSLTVDPSGAPEPGQTSPTTARRADVTTADAPAFRFTWFRPDDRLGVIVGHDDARLPAQFQQMLQRILVALSPRYRDIVLQGEPFHWPLDAAMPGDVDTARQVVRAFLRRRCGKAQPPFTLILMDEPPVWLFPADAGDVASTMLEPVSVPGRPEQILRVPSLATMARDASAKRPAWAAMQSLIRPLAQCDQG